MHVDEDRPTGEQLDASWDETFERLRSFIAARVGDDEVAADIAQDVLVRSIAAGALDRVDNPSAWLYRSARNAVIDHYRTRHVHDPLDPAAELWPEPEPADDRPNDATRDLAACLQPLVTRLPEIYRDALDRVDLAGQSHHDAAARGGHLDVGHEVTGPAGPPPAQGPAHRLLRRAGGQAGRRGRLPAQGRPLRLSWWRLTEAQRRRADAALPGRRMRERHWRRQPGSRPVRSAGAV